ncbi:MAG: aldo/keto reductase [Defluviitaleaceae bacterium]|nr:aldo/keto reductase [Defluviitaleaceae bacterium]
MQYRILGKTGLRVSLLGMGCMRLPFVDGDCTKGVDLDAAIELLQFAADNGVNYFDNAFGYHGQESEAIVGEALESRRDKVILATKQPWWVMPDDDSIRRNLESTLKKMRTDCIDVYMLHRVIPEAWDDIKRRGIFEKFDGFRREGLIKHIGFSYHGNFDTFKAVVTEYPWEMCMVQQNMLDIDTEVTQAGLEFAGDAGLGVTIMEPLRGGGLAFAPPGVREIYGENLRSPAEWAFRHLVDTAQVSSIVSGMADIDVLKKNIALFSQGDMVAGCLSSDEKKTIAAARDAYKKIVSVPCTACNYCVPCPEGVQIPGIFTQYNEFKMFEHSQNPRRVYMFTTRAGGDFTKCTGCARCVKKCPQLIDIPKGLAVAHEALKGWSE